MKSTIQAGTLAAFMMLAACGGGLPDNSGVTAEEALALNEAEAMLDAPPGSSGENGANGGAPAE